MDNNYILCEDLFMEADRLISEQKIGEAFAKLNSILQENPNFGKAHNHLGWIYETKYKDYPNAEKHYKQAIEITPEYHATYYNYAVVLSTLQKWPELTQLLNKALSIPGINKGSINNEFAIMYEAQGKFDEAIEAYKQYILNNYNNDNIETARQSIERCKKKKDILSGL